MSTNFKGEGKYLLHKRGFFIDEVGNIPIFIFI